MPDATNKPTAKETADFLRSLSMPEFDAVMKLASVRRANGLPFPTPADCREYLDRKFIESSKQMAGNEFDDLIEEAA